METRTRPRKKRNTDERLKVCDCFKMIDNFVFLSTSTSTSMRRWTGVSNPHFPRRDSSFLSHLFPVTYVRLNV
jgi:hypothetical protein